MSHEWKKNSPDAEDVEEYFNCFKTVKYIFDTSGENINLQLDTLLDTGSPISFIKEAFVPKEILDTLSMQGRKYSGRNSNELKILGEISSSIVIDGVMRESQNIFVVPNSTMKSSVVLGRKVF